MPKNMFGQEIDGDGNVIGWSGGVGGSWSSTPTAPATAPAPAPAAPTAAPAAGADQYGITDDQYKTYFGRNNSQADINAAAGYLGLNQGQLAALQQKFGYSGIITKQGANLTNDQLKQFYSSGADEGKAAETLGLDNEAVQNARRISGGIGIYTDPGQYAQYAIWADGQRKNPGLPNPYGTGGYDEWRAGQKPSDLAKWKTGSYSPNSGVAYDPTGAYSGTSGGSGGAGGGGGPVRSGVSGGGGIVSSAMRPASASVQQWDVTAPQTVNQQVANVANQDGPLMQQARARALMDANERGLINSSMAVGNAQSAVLDKAIEIGARDASTNAQAAQFNANAANQRSMFDSGQSNQWDTNALDRANNASEREKDRAAAIAAAGFDAQTRKDLAAIEQTYRTQLNSDQGFDRQFSQYADTLLRIDTDPNLDAAAKTRLKENALTSLRSYATIRKLNLDLNFDKPAPATPGAPTSPTSPTQPTAPSPSTGDNFA